MTEDKKASEQSAGKPAWFRLVDSDAPSAQVSKVDKKLPVIALIVTGVIAVSGTFFATASEQNQVPNNSSASTSTNAISDVVETNNGPGATAAATQVNSNSTVNVSSPAAAANGLQDPAQGGITAPRRDHEEDDGDDHWGWLPGHDDHDEDDDDDHEREERH